MSRRYSGSLSSLKSFDTVVKFTSRGCREVTEKRALLSIKAYCCAVKPGPTELIGGIFHNFLPGSPGAAYWPRLAPLKLLSQLYIEYNFGDRSSVRCCEVAWQSGAPRNALRVLSAVQSHCRSSSSSSVAVSAHCACAPGTATRSILLGVRHGRGRPHLLSPGLARSRTVLFVFCCLRPTWKISVISR